MTTLLLHIGAGIPAVNSVAVNNIRLIVIPLQVIIVCLLFGQITLHTIESIIVVLNRDNTIPVMKRIASLLRFCIILAAPGKKDDQYKKPFHSPKVTK
jgi:ADP-dependent phosphofructokinase/glucokinase